MLWYVYFNIEITCKKKSSEVKVSCIRDCVRARRESYINLDFLALESALVNWFLG